MADLMRYLDEVKHCPHCEQQLFCCEAPPIHIGDGLGWGSEVLFICLNDDCPVFLNGWDKIEQQYGHHASYRYMQLPNSNEKNYMMVGNADAFKASVIDKKELVAQNERYQQQKKMLARLDTCVEEKDVTAPLAILLDESAAKEKRQQAADYLAKIGDLTIVDPLRNHTFRDPAFEHAANTAINVVLKRNFKKECPYCTELVKEQAKRCMHCQADLS